MINTNSSFDTAGLLARIKAIVLTPRSEWQKISDEPATPQSLIVGYAAPIAAARPVANFIGGQVFGYGDYGFYSRPSLLEGLANMATGFVVTLVALYALALIINVLAPQFAGTANRTQALKLAIYGATAGMLVGILRLYPISNWLGWLAILPMLYSLYLYYLGVNPLMKVPADKASGFTVVMVICAAILAILIVPLTTMVVSVFSLSGTGPA